MSKISNDGLRQRKPRETSQSPGESPSKEAHRYAEVYRHLTTIQQEACEADAGTAATRSRSTSRDSLESRAAVQVEGYDSYDENASTSAGIDAYIRANEKVAGRGTERPTFTKGKNDTTSPPSSSSSSSSPPSSSSGGSGLGYEGGDRKGGGFDPYRDSTPSPSPTKSRQTLAAAGAATAARAAAAASGFAREEKEAGTEAETEAGNREAFSSCSPSVPPSPPIQIQRNWYSPDTYVAVQRSHVPLPSSVERRERENLEHAFKSRSSSSSADRADIYPSRSPSVSVHTPLHRDREERGRERGKGGGEGSSGDTPLSVDYSAGKSHRGKSGDRGRSEGSGARDGGYIDAWGDPFISPSKLRQGLKPSALTSPAGYNNTACMERSAGGGGVGKDSSADDSNTLGARGLAIGGEGGAVFNALVWLSTKLLSPFGVRNLAFMHTAMCSVYAFMQIMLFGLCCFCNPFDAWGSKWGSVNVFSGAIRLPAMDLAVLFPFWFRPIGIKKLEWGSVLALVSFTGGIHMAMNVSQFNVGVIVETVEKDKSLISPDKKVSVHVQMYALMCIHTCIYFGVVVPVTCLLVSQSYRNYTHALLPSSSPSPSPSSPNLAFYLWTSRQPQLQLQRKAPAATLMQRLRHPPPQRQK